MNFQAEMTIEQLKQACAYWLQGHLLMIVGDEGAYYTRDQNRPKVFKFNKTIPITDQHRSMLPNLNKLV